MCFTTKIWKIIIYYTSCGHYFHYFCQTFLRTHYNINLWKPEKIPNTKLSVKIFKIDLISFISMSSVTLKIFSDQKMRLTSIDRFPFCTVGFVSSTVFIWVLWYGGGFFFTGPPDSSVIRDSRYCLSLPSRTNCSFIMSTSSLWAELRAEQ